MELTALLDLPANLASSAQVAVAVPDLNGGLATPYKAPLPQAAPVHSVAGRSGDVVLTVADVEGAYPEGNPQGFITAAALNGYATTDQVASLSTALGSLSASLAGYATTGQLDSLTTALNSLSATVAALGSGTGATTSTATGGVTADSLLAGGAVSVSDRILATQQGIGDGKQLVGITPVQMAGFVAKNPAHLLTQAVAGTVVLDSTMQDHLLVATGPVTLMPPNPIANMGGDGFRTFLVNTKAGNTISFGAGLTVTGGQTNSTAFGIFAIVGVTANVPAGEIVVTPPASPGSNTTAGNGTAAPSPTLTITAISPLVAGATSTVTLAYANGAPTSLTATSEGVALALGNITVNAATSGSNATAAGTATATFTAPAAGTHSLIVSGTGTYAATSAADSITTTAPVAAPSITNTLRIEGFVYGGAVEAMPTAPDSLPNDFYGYYRFGFPGGNVSWIQFKRTDGSYVGYDVSTLIAGLSRSPTEPPGPATTNGSFPAAGNIDGYGLLTKQGQEPLWNQPPGTAFGTGASPAPGTNFYIWFSEDNGAHWSVDRDQNNVAVAHPVVV